MNTIYKFHSVTQYTDIYYEFHSVRIIYEHNIRSFIVDLTVLQCQSLYSMIGEELTLIFIESIPNKLHKKLDKDIHVSHKLYLLTSMLL